MASHSLPYSASVPTVNPAHRPSQLPSTLSSVGISTRFESVTGPGRLRSGSNSTSKLHSHARTGSNFSTTSKPRPSLPLLTDPQPPQSPTKRSFAPPISAPAGSSTHAGGILPSASFFRPSRPNQPSPGPYSVPPRPHSAASSGGPHSPIDQSFSFQLHPLTQDVIYDSDASGSMPHLSSEHAFSATGRISRTSTAEDMPRQLSTKHTKYSREPLLPIGGGRARAASTTTYNSKPSVTRNMSERSVAKSSQGTVSAGALVRNSVEKFKLGISLESVRRSLSMGSPSTSPNPRGADGALSPISQSNGRPTFETKHFDDDLTSRYKSSSSPPLHLRRSPSTNFISRPPEDGSLSAVPRADPKKRRTIRNYEEHPSRNRFLCRGRFLTGGDSPWAFIGSLVVVFGIAGTWFGTTCVWWWHHESPAVAIVGAYMCLLTVSTMLTTAFRDPGILPRNLDLDPPYPSTSPSDGGTRAPLPRDLKVRAGVVRVKYCPTCQTYRPPRSSHCKMCDNCVDGCDHHCQWVNNCVGRRNYTYFFAFITSATLTLCLVIVTSALHIYLVTRRDHVDFSHALNEAAGSAVVFSLSIVVVWPVAALLSYHMRLLILNVTTIEQIRNQAHKSLVPGPAPPNPFGHGSWRRNLADVLCRPAGYSWVEPHAVATEDKREINPGMLEDDGEGRYEGEGNGWGRGTEEVDLEAGR